MATQWLLVAGTGKEWGLAETTVWTSRAVGAASAERGYGLVVGGWHGVDYLAAEAFAQTLAATRPTVPLSDVLL